MSCKLQTSHKREHLRHIELGGTSAAIRTADYTVERGEKR